MWRWWTPLLLQLWDFSCLVLCAQVASSEFSCSIWLQCGSGVWTGMAVGRWHCLHGLLTDGCSPVPVASIRFLLGRETTSFKVWWHLRACRRYTYWLMSLCGWVVSFIVYLHREPFFVPIRRLLCSPWLHIWHGWAALCRGWWRAEDTQLHASFLLFGCMADVINSTTSRARLEEIKCSFIWVCVPTSSSFSVCDSLELLEWQFLYFFGWWAGAIPVRHAAASPNRFALRLSHNQATAWYRSV